METFLPQNFKETLRINCGVIQKLKDIKIMTGNEWKQLK